MFLTMLCTSSLRGGRIQTFLLGDHRELEPPDPMPNSEVKRLIADGSVGLPHVRVGHRQALIPKTPADGWGFFMTKVVKQKFLLIAKIKAKHSGI